MANDLNQCSFIGRLGQEPTIRYTPDGKAVASLSIACGSSWKDQSGEKKESTEWIRLSAFGKLAEIIGQYCHKGQQIFVSGRMQTRQWEKDGVKRYSTEVVVDRMQMLGGRRAGDDQANAPAEGADGGAAVAADDFDDSVPF